MTALISDQADITKLGTILGVWAHPDDETFTMGGIMTAAINNGQTVVCVTATRGEAGVQDDFRWPSEKLAEIRSAELSAAYEIMGVSHHSWLDYPDGECNKVSDTEAVESIVALIQTHQPDSIFTFGPDGLTGHDDHKTVSRWAEQAVKRANSHATIYHAVQTPRQYQSLTEADKEFNIFFNIDKPPLSKEGDCAIHFELDEKLYQTKLEALKAMPSQYEALLKAYEDHLQTSLAIEAFVRAG